MFKKILAGVSSVSLALGIAALTSIVGPAAAASAATSGPPAAKDGETCVTFSADDKQTFYNGGLSVTKGAITVTISTQYQAGKDWNVSSSGNPLATITINSNGGWQDRTGQTLLNGDYGSDIVGAVICTKAAVVVDPTPYVLVAWLMPSWSGDDHTPSWTPYQTFFAKADLAAKNLNALDGQLTTCGTSYQVDLYNDSAITTSTIAGGKLYGPNNPGEDFPSPSGWGITYKLVHNADCLPQDAVASASVSPASCQAAGAATFSLTNADWADTTGPEDQTPGSHVRTANAWSGHLFSNGLATLDVPYTVPDKLAWDDANCYNPVPVKPSYSPIRACGVYGSITLVNTAYITYAITFGDGLHGWNVIEATPVSPYTFAHNVQHTWVVYLGDYFDCYHPKVNTALDRQCTWDSNTMTSIENLVVTFDNSGSTVGVWFSIPSAGISELVGAGQTDQVTITIGTTGSSSFWVFADGFPLQKIHKIAAFDGCEPVTVTADPGSTATCSAGSVVDGAVNVDWMPTKVSYTITGGPSNITQAVTAASTALPPGTYTVTATAQPGYVLSGTFSWDETIDDPSPCTVPCDQLGLQALALAAVDCTPTLETWETAYDPTQPVCTGHDGSLTVGDVGGGISFFTGKVNYYLDGSVTPMATQTVAVGPGTHTLSAAVVVSGDGLTGTVTSPVSFTITPSTLACADLKTLALTGSSPSGWFGLASGLVAAGMALVAMRLVRRRRDEQN